MIGGRDVFDGVRVTLEDGEEVVAWRTGGAVMLSVFDGDEYGCAAASGAAIDKLREVFRAGLAMCDRAEVHREPGLIPEREIT